MVALPSILVFNPDDELAAGIVRDLAEPGGSLDAVAKARGISLADLALWLTTPRARERMLTIEQGGCAHVRMAASLHLSKAVAALLRVLDTFNALAASRPADDPLVIRAALHANKAAYHLSRLSRIVPIDDSRALGSLAARARSHADSSQRTASVSERTLSSSDSWLPSQPVHPAGALHDLPPAAVLKTDANSPRAIEVGGSASTSMSSPAPSSAASAPPSPTVHPAGALHDLHPTSSLRDDVDSPRVACLLEEQACGSSPAPASPPAPVSPASPLCHSALSVASAVPLTLDHLNVQLEALARTLGIDTSDLNDLDEMDDVPPLPPEFLATLPPELAAFLSETDPFHADPTSRPDPNSRPAPTPTPEPVGASP